MTFTEYQKKAQTTAVYPDVGNNFVYPTLGLASEAGEIAGKIKKVLRDRAGRIDDARRADIEKEIGDVLWYAAQLSTELGSSLENIAEKNIEKLASRKERGTLHGDGDQR